MISVAIPDYIEPTGYLPPGRHLATWTELATRFAWNPHRQNLTDKLLEALQMLRSAGCNRVWVNGSYTTDKEQPSDVDVLYDAWGIRPIDLHPWFRTETKANIEDRTKRYGGDYFPIYDDELDGTLINNFQTDRSDTPKGIIELPLTTLPQTERS
jgi:hypothetical protein